MTELAAVGLASNIVGFIDFGLKLFHEGKELYESAEGASVQHNELETIISDLKILIDDLQPTPPITKSDKSLASLALGCKKLATELLRALTRLKVKNGQNRKWESFKQALKCVMKEKELRSLEQRIEKYRKQLGVRLLYTLR